MLVEDDKSLREIYGVRLLAEGYDIVSAGDGEEALAMAIKERPVLIVTDVMMPKISGFDMLDILRSTTETKNIKVIVMTALGSEEQRQRGDQLGADRYLVKSQVGIEDVVRTVHEVLGDKTPAATPPTAATPSIPIPPPAAPPAPAAPAAAPPAPPAASVPAAPATQPVAAPAPNPAGPQPQSQRTMASTPQPAPPQSHVAATTAPVVPNRPATPPPVGRNKVIQPLNNPATARVDINELLDRELAKEAGVDINDRPAIASTQQEKAIVQNQLAQFSAQKPSTETPSSKPADPAKTPTIQIDSNGNVSMPGSSPALPSTPPAAPPTPPAPVS